tara:strand:+ start:78490 stop:81087 length:2598 start_codon:yes stop_codon:yes gene_type:complete
MSKKKTPLMIQYENIKRKHPEAMLLFRVGDFYETFGEDAIKASKILNIVLTNRANGSSKIELAGFPYHSLDNYLPKLVRSGQRVAICDQLEDPKSSKGIVKRGVTELVTPGLSYNDLVLDVKKNNFLAAIYYSNKNIGIAFLDISTGEFLVSEGSKIYIDKLLQSFKPTEILFQRDCKSKILDEFKLFSNHFFIDEWVFNGDYTNDLLLKKFNVKSLKGFGVNELQSALISAGVVLHYLNETHHNKTQHIISINRIEQDKYLWMDKFTINNLELFSSNNESAKTLFDIINKTLSPMGARLLRRWLALPLKNIDSLNYRHNIVEELVKNDKVALVIENKISKIGDLERLSSKVATLRINPKECNKLKESLQILEPIKKICLESSNKELKKQAKKINTCLELVDKINFVLNPEAPFLINKGNIINKNVNSELDSLRNLKKSGKTYLNEMLDREKLSTGISSLKISFNNVFGYYLEVRNTHKDKVPTEWIRKQTLVNAERYITEELKEYENQIISADSKIIEIENLLYKNLLNEILPYINQLQINAKIIAELDCLFSFSKIAQTNRYSKPKINNSFDLIIKKGRHPVIEQQLSEDEFYVPNDVILNRDSQQIMMITGPNMSGKSALLRQTALIVLMAQIGSFVPADSAQIGIVDKIFTRVGASDNISMGESTFMVEMNETASILNNLSDKSLILLDEIGRGTSTYDGVSIAWSITEYLHEHETKPKTLFATHYHELNKMEGYFDRIKNYNVSVKEVNKNIIFIRELKPGGIEHSFGIQVAKMAGMPKKILENANNMLIELENKNYKKTIKTSQKRTGNLNRDMQLSFVKLDDPILEELRDQLLGIDINNLTPMDAFMKLNKIKKLLDT